MRSYGTLEEKAVECKLVAGIKITAEKGNHMGATIYFVRCDERQNEGEKRMCPYLKKECPYDENRDTVKTTYF